MVQLVDCTSGWKNVPSRNRSSTLNKVELKRSQDVYSVSCPALPACWSQGNTKSESLENIDEAIEEYLDFLAVEDGGSIKPHA